VIKLPDGLERGIRGLGLAEYEKVTRSDEVLFARLGEALPRLVVGSDDIEAQARAVLGYLVASRHEPSLATV
jgi:hypothetical protein